MKAILLAGGKGTRLRPLTVHTPKPIVPILNRPFLYYQIDLLKQIPEIDEVILSLNYQPRRIEEIFGEGEGLGIRVRYVVEPMPLGTGGAIRYAGDSLTESVVVFNGDVLTQVDLAAVLRLHRERKAKATIVLTPVDNPRAYGLVETDRDGNVKRFLEKPGEDEITCNTINAGIYVLEPDTFDRIPKDTAWSIERSFFPSLIERGETFVAYVYDGYWIDIGTPAKYMQVHRDIMDGRYSAPPFNGTPGRPGSRPTRASRTASRSPARASSTKGSVIKSGRAHPPLLRDRPADPRRGRRRRSTARSSGRTAGSAPRPSIKGSILGRNCHVGRNAIIESPAVLGDKTVITDYSRSIRSSTDQPEHLQGLRRPRTLSPGGQRGGGAADRPRLRRLPRRQAHRRVARHAAVVAVHGRGLHRGRAPAGRRRRRLRHDGHRHALLRGRARRPRRRRADHRVAQSRRSTTASRWCARRRFRCRAKRASATSAT